MQNEESNTMKSRLTLLALLSALSLQPSGLLAQGSLTPPGAPAPTMKSLDQIESRTAITNTAGSVTISQPGSYYLTSNITVTNGYGITIATNGVTLDLNGYTISSTAANIAGVGIALNGGLSDISISNGHIRGGATNNGSGVYGGGLGAGIDTLGIDAVNVLVSRISVTACRVSGIYLGTSLGGSVVEFCTVRMVGGTGINAATVRQSSALECGNNGINAEQVFESRGESSGSGNGINASRTAIGCYGRSVIGTGISAANAAYCTGNRSGGTAIQATVANGCYAASGTNNINHKYNMP